MAFENIIGQNKVKKILLGAVMGERLSHAYAFCGAEGMGKRTLANDLSKLLLCTNKKETSKADQNILSHCDECDSCRTFKSGANPDFCLVETNDDTLKIDTIRHMQEDISIGPMYSDKKIYVICDAHKMTPQAQNCLLKTLEEPPPYVVIILTVSLFENLLETIKSRVFKIDFVKNTTAEVKEAILNVLGPLTDHDFMASYADGNIGNALKFIQDDDFVEMRGKILEYLINLGDENSHKGFTVISVFEEYKENIQEALDVCSMFFRDLMVIKTQSNQNILINSDKKDIIIRNFNNFSKARVIKCIDLIEKVRIGLSQNANFSLAMEYLTMGLQEE